MLIIDLPLTFNWETNCIHFTSCLMDRNSNGFISHCILLSNACSINGHPIAMAVS